jgi:NADPH:quinone reductase-like Zn-dependent oxidoreductase
MVPVPATMSAVLLTGHGDDDVLDYRTDVPVPLPRANEVLIRVGAAGINNTDINTRLGWYAADGADGGAWTGEALAFPRIQGADVCGAIVAVGAGVAATRIGERVLVQPCLRSLRRGLRDAWLGSEIDGGFAQFVRAPAADTYPVASALSDAELASLPCAYATAENLLTRAGVSAGEQVLVTGATGGVGSAAVQLAMRRGARVIAVASARKQAACAALGATRVIDGAMGLRDSLGADTIDVVIDVVGGERWPDLLDALRPGGRYAVSGAVAGPHVALDLRKLYLKDLTMFGCTAQADGVFANLLGYIERNEIRPLVARTYALADLVVAQRAFVARRHVGKLVVIPPR